MIDFSRGMKKGPMGLNISKGVYSKHKRLNYVFGAVLVFPTCLDNDNNVI